MCIGGLTDVIGLEATLTLAVAIAATFSGKAAGPMATMPLRHEARPSMTTPDRWQATGHYRGNVTWGTCPVCQRKKRTIMSGPKRHHGMMWVHNRPDYPYTYCLGSGLFSCEVMESVNGNGTTPEPPTNSGNVNG